MQAESRMSLTAASADEWLPLRPGSEPHFLIAVARLLLDEKLARNAAQVPSQVREAILSANLPDLIRTSGIEEKRLRRVARELGESETPLVVAGASILQTNSLQALVAAHYLNLMLGNVGKPGGMFPPNPELGAAPQNANIPEALKSAEILLLDGENPVYTFPSASAIPQRLAGPEMIVSFGSFIDDTVAYADLILPDHHALESDAAVVPAVSPKRSIAVSKQFVRPLYDTRAIGQTLGDIAHKMNLAFEPVTPEAFVKPFLPPGQTWEEVVRQGGLWLDAQPEPPVSKPLDEKIAWGDPAFAGAPDQFPLHFQPYLSLQYHDGRGANLPWMQELPDPASSSMWDLPVELDPETANRLNVTTGDPVRVESAHGRLEALTYVHPAALPGVVSMAIGEGHTHYGRYASGRGANPISILAPVWDDSVGSLSFGATRVRVTRLDRKREELIQFSPNDRQHGPWGYR